MQIEDIFPRGDLEHKQETTADANTDTNENSWKKNFDTDDENDWQQQMKKYVMEDNYEAVNDEIRRQLDSLNAMY